MVSKIVQTIQYCVFMAFIFCLVVGCSDSRKGKKQIDTSSVLASLPRTQTLYVGGFQWGPPVSFNPLAITPSWPVTGNMNLIYEALFGYDLLDGSLKGIIGKSYVIHDSVMEIALHENARWHNGDPVTADDVLYSFSLHKKYATNFSASWTYIANIKKIDDHLVEFLLSTEKK